MLMTYNEKYVFTYLKEQNAVSIDNRMPVKNISVIEMKDIEIDHVVTSIAVLDNQLMLLIDNQIRIFSIDNLILSDTKAGDVNDGIEKELKIKVLVGKPNLILDMVGVGNKVIIELIDPNNENLGYAEVIYDSLNDGVLTIGTSVDEYNDICIKRHNLEQALNSKEK